MTGRWIATAMMATALATAGAQAAPSEETTYLNFSRSVALPGATLAPGTYIFERVENHADLVRVLSADRSHVFLTQFTHPVERALASPEPAVTLGESEGGSAPPVMAWYPQGAVVGHRFVY